MGEVSGEVKGFKPLSPEQKFRPKSLDFAEKLRLLYKKPNVEGRENLPQGACVIATTHLSGFDVPEVYAEITKDRKAGISMQESILTHPLFKLAANLIGKDNLFPLSNRNSSILRDEDLEKMKRALVEDGRTLVVAAHNPTKDWELPDRPGLTPIILAHQAKVPLVPVALDIQTRIPVRERVISAVKSALRHRPESKIIVGNPILFPEIPEEKLQLVINLFSTEKRRLMTEEQIQEAQVTLNVLKSEAGEVMKALASNLPAEKRGKWG